jgi:hypothetical protein
LQGVAKVIRALDAAVIQLVTAVAKMAREQFRIKRRVLHQQNI